MNDLLPMAAGDPEITVRQGDVEVPKDLGALGVSGQEKETTLVRPSCTGHDSSSGCPQATPEGPPLGRPGHHHHGQWQQKGGET